MNIQTRDGILLRNIPDGTPDEAIKARIAQIRASRGPQESPTSAKNLLGAGVEPLASMASGMVAQPAAGIAGLATAAGNAMGMTDKDPADVVRSVGNSMTYEPRTTGGKNASVAVGAPFELLGEGATKAGEMTSDLLGPAAGAAVTTAIQAAPAALGFRGPSTLANTTGFASRSLMRSALKPSTKEVISGDAAKAVQTLLDEGINVTPGGAAKLDTKLGSLNDQIAEAILNSQGRVNKNAVAGRLQDTVNRAERQVNPASDVAAVEKAWNEFSDHPLIPGADMPIQLAQEMKQGTYRALKNKYGEIGSADTEAQKALARGLKEEIATVEPSVAPLNAQESGLLNAKDMLDRRVAVAGNKNPLGLGPLGKSVEAVAAMLLDRSEWAKSMAARGLNPGKGSISDQSLAAATGPETFDDDMKARKAIIAALLQRGANAP